MKKVLSLFVLFVLFFSFSNTYSMGISPIIARDKPCEIGYINNNGEYFYNTPIHSNSSYCTTSQSLGTKIGIFGDFLRSSKGIYYKGEKLNIKMIIIILLFFTLFLYVLYNKKKYENDIN